MSQYYQQRRITPVSGGNDDDDDGGVGSSGNSLAMTFTERVEKVESVRLHHKRNSF